MISEKEVEQALAFLDDDATLETLTRNARLSESLLKHTEAVEMKKHPGLSAAGQTREARASDAYYEALNQDATDYAKLIAYKGRRDAAAHVIEMWRSQNANMRSSSRIG